MQLSLPVRVQISRQFRVIGGGRYAISEISCAVGGVDAAAGLLPGTGKRGSRLWPGIWLRGRATGVRVWVLRLLSLRLRAIRLLWARLVCGRSLYRCRTVVSRLLRPRM